MARANEAKGSAAPRVSANARFKQTFGAWLWGSVVVATVLHFGLFQLFPELTASAVPIKRAETDTIVMPAPDLPDPPPPIEEPGLPVVSDVELDVSVTIPETTLDHWPEISPPPSEEERAGDEPSFSPTTVKPKLDRAEAVRIVERYYPRPLKDAGVGGQVHVWVLIDTAGVVTKAQIETSSGNASLDEAALLAAREFSFTPAWNRDKRVPVWLNIPITFSVRR